MNNSSQAELVIEHIHKKVQEVISQQIVPNITTTTVPAQIQSSFSYLWIGVAVLVVFLVLWRLTKKKRPSRSFIYLVGERNSGKTRLFYKLTKGKELQTVPSCKNNVTGIMVENRPKTIVDVTGDNHSKEEFLTNIGRAFRIILVVDGAAPKSFAATAELLYRISTLKAFQENQPELLILLNKSDRTEFVGERMFRKQIEDEIERIKLSRKALIEDREGEEDLLREQKQRYNLPFPILESSILDNVKKTEQFIEEGTIQS